MYHYLIYGLRISSSRRIDLLKNQNLAGIDLHVDWQISSAETPDNTLDWQPVETETLQYYKIISLWKAAGERGEQTKVCFEPEGGRILNFVIDETKRKLSVFHHEDESRSDLESYLVGPALGFLMRLRGRLCLHSSAIEIGGRALALVGHSTAGKSTIAAGLAKTGAGILADDITVLDQSGEEFVVSPGYPKVRLRPGAARFLTPDAGSLPIVYSGRDSRYFTLDEEMRFRPEPANLAAIYILGGVDDKYKRPFIEPVASQAKLVSLLAYTYGSYVVTEDLRAGEFRLLAAVAKTVPVRKLFYAHDISTLHAQCELIRRDFRQIIASSERSAAT